MGTAKLAEEHSHKLTAAGEASCMVLGLLGLESRKKLEELTEYATEFIH